MGKFRNLANAVLGQGILNLSELPHTALREDTLLNVKCREKGKAVPLCATLGFSRSFRHGRGSLRRSSPGLR